MTAGAVDALRRQARDLAVRQLSDPRMRSVLWQSLGLSLLLQIALVALAVLPVFATLRETAPVRLNR